MSSAKPPEPDPTPKNGPVGDVPMRRAFPLRVDLPQALNADPSRYVRPRSPKAAPSDVMLTQILDVGGLLDQP